MRQRAPRRLKTTPASSPLIKAHSLDPHGEPTHPDLVREQGTFEPGDDDYYDPDLFLGPCLCKRGTGIVRVFWFWFDDGSQLGMKVRSLSYGDGARAARAEFENHPALSCNAKIVKLASVEVQDELSGQRDAQAALQPKTRW